MTKEIDVLFPDLKAAVGFCRLNSVSSCHMSICSGGFSLDATDIMNIFSLDVVSPMRVRIDGPEKSLFLLLDAYEKAGIKCLSA